jgi:hypothetical protein
MRANIVLGGLLGIALGAGAVFAVSHGVFAAAPIEDLETDDATSGDEPRASTDSAGFEASTESTPIRHRPLRPGSERIGNHLIAPAQS